MTDPGSLRTSLAFLPQRALIGLARRLPYRLRLAFGSALLRGAVALLPRLRTRVENNLRLIFPQSSAGDRRRIRKGMADNFGRTFAEILTNRSFHAGGFWIAPDPGPGVDAILRAAQDGTGAVLVTGHFGQWEAGRAWMKSLGIACAGVYRPLDDLRLNAIYLDNLEFGGSPFFPKSRRGVRGIVGHVGRGGIVAILTDQFERRGEALDFIGHPAPTALVPAELAFRSKLPLVPIYGIRQPDGLHVQVVVEVPIPHSTVREMMQAVNDSLAAQVRAHPGQYYWLHRRWVKSFGKGTR
jgi:KDO2-lipid IV(A) lauroyltransferase